MNSPILAPAAVLVLWSLVMLVWMTATRLPALKKMGVDLNKAIGGRGQNLDGVLPDNVNWKAHNYAHLMEQPTLFYAVVLILAFTAMDSELTVALAWVYVALRIVHSIVQATINRVSIRLTLFMLSTLALLALAICALCATL